MDSILSFLVPIILVVLVLLVLAANVRVVPQSRAFVIERLGAFQGVWGVGLHFKIPFIERVAKNVSLKEQVVDFPPQPVITKDNVTMQIDTVIYFQITDPKLYTYGVENPMSAIENLTATTLRNIIGDLELDQSLTSRDHINGQMRAILDEATDNWGIKVNRVELKNIMPPRDIQESMEKQMRAERERRESILQAEGQKQSQILVAEGEKQSAILRADAAKQAAILQAEGAKQAKILEAEAQAQAIMKVQQATADAIKLINEANPGDGVLKIKALEAFTAAANGKAGIADLQGFDAAGDLAHVGKDGEPTGAVQGQLREAAKQLAASASASKIAAVKSVAGTGTTMTVSDLPNGLYLIVDSDGVPMIVGTPVQGTKTLNGVTLGTLTVKSKTTTIDKKVSRDRLNKGTFIDSKAGGTEDSASFTVGETVDFKYVFTLPNMQAATQTVVKDTMNGLTLAGDPAFSIDGKTVTPSVAKGENGDGFTATFDQAFIEANSAKQVAVTYKATVANAKRAAQASNTAAISTTFYDGTAASKTTVDSNDTATVSAYDVNIKKTNWDGKQALQGAGFKIQNKDTGKWMKQGPKTGSWTYVDTQGEASQFTTGANGQLNIAGLGAGNYHVVESKVPDSMTSLVTVAFDMNITDGGKVSTSADANKLITGQPTNDNKWTITVKNIDALTELPQTGGLLGNTMIGVIVIAMAGGVAYLTVQSKKRREAHAL